ncbi:putative metalloprotease CJM1_0395 family protein [Minwuia thermotolerans]|uniref:Catalase n=1 Tax=Minwuia thermotolerans TaxID=2056226 RepID=A0A2M9G3P0_9PROT|nr:putative metalloprotease CJM1_0395 family protein [Minwuia thermotolerans]PJK30304.1 hypothetical protein CVT23_07945 [Minwuia thermotolerans]
MIVGLSSTPPATVANSTARSSREAAPQGVRPVAESLAEYRGRGNGFAEARGGFTVAGGTLVAAQEEGSRSRKPAEEPTVEPRSGAPSELGQEEKKEVRDLQAQDREVRAHEQAHARAGGRYASAPEYELERGPDGRSYATGGHVSISTSPVPGDPQATVDKMDIVRKAALAPAEPSGQDRRVAADATAKRNAARAEIAAQTAEEAGARFDEGGEVKAPEPREAADIPTGEAAATAGPQSAGDSIGAEARDEQGDGAATDGLGAVDDRKSRAEGFMAALSQGIDRIAGIATGGMTRLEAQAMPAAAAEAAAPVRRTGVDIRV